ncbi:Cytochrome c biogenesis protein transmembrane region [Syntrophobacter sp. SbD1]|nr:Cytochrome c biogenesis protein transmembrane region [Syntrophobacter sp. SbD1]
MRLRWLLVSSFFSILFFTGTAHAGHADAGGLGMVWAIISIFLGGMALNLTPCVYPLIPVTISYFSAKSLAMKSVEGGQSAPVQQNGRGAILISALLYTLGIAITNSMLGVFAALSGRLLGTLLENPATLVVVSVIMVVIALSMFDVWELRLPAWIIGAAARNYAGYLGSLFMGLTLGIVAAPCIGPFVAGVLIMVANSRDPVFGFWIFFALSLGMGFPLFVLALLSDRLTMLPKSGEWMLWVRRVMGWVMIGAAAYFVAPIMPELAALALISVIALAAGIHLGWVDRSGAGSAAFYRIKKGIGVVCIVAACAIIWYAIPSEGVKWTPYSENALNEAKESGRPVILDFYADWCSSCRHMDRMTFHEHSIVEAAAKDFIMIRVDLTRSDDRAKERLARSYGIQGIPAVIFLKPGGKEVVDLRVMDAMPPGEFLARMNGLRNRAGLAVNK